MTNFTIIRDTKDKLPGAFTGVTHKKMHEAAFDIDKTQKTNFLALLPVLHTKRHLKQLSTLIRDNKFIGRAKYTYHKL